MKVSVWKPWFLYRPSQIVRRIAYSWKEPPENAVFELPWGGRLRANGRKTIGRSLAHTGIYELAESELLFRLIRPGDTVLDVGANIGYMTALMAHCVGTQGKVHAFEPHPDLFEILTANVEELRLRRKSGKVETHRCAVSCSSGTVTLVCPSEYDQNDGVSQVRTAAPGEANAYAVSAVALDELFTGGEIISVLKIDIEGHELNAFQGAPRLLRDRITHVVFEEHEGVESAACQFLRDLGFNILQFGWTIRGLVLADASNRRLSHRYEAPNFIATRNPEEVFERCRDSGWQVLQPR